MCDMPTNAKIKFVLDVISSFENNCIVPTPMKSTLRPIMASSRVLTKYSVVNCLIHILHNIV